MSAALQSSFCCSRSGSVAESWAAYLSPFFDFSPRAETELTPNPRMSIYHLGAMLVGDIAAPAQNLSRCARKAARQGVDHVVLQFYTKGRSRIGTARGERRVEPGTAAVFDLSQPLVMEADQSVEALNILLPRQLLGEEADRPDEMHGAVVDYESDPAGRLLFAYLGGLLSCADRMAPHHLAGFGEAAGRLCGTFLAGAAGGGAAPEARARLDLRRFIQDNLAAPDLDADGLARRFGMSRATLYREFAPDGGVQSYIRERRLLAALRQLTRPAKGGRRPRVSSVAYGVGFSDEKSFSRAFRQRFGFLPSEVRAGGEAAPAPAAGEGADELLRWVRELVG